LIKQIENDGETQIAQRGSHRHYKYPSQPGKVTMAGAPQMRCIRRLCRRFCDRQDLRNPSRKKTLSRVPSRVVKWPEIEVPQMHNLA